MVIKKILKRKKKTPKYSVKLTPEVWEHLPELTKKQISELLARLKETELERDEWKKKYEELKGKIEPEEVKVLKEALKQKEILKRKKEARRIVLVPFKVVKNELKPVKINFVPYGGGIIRGAKSVYRYFGGWELEESEDGIYRSVNFILKKEPDDKKIVRLQPSPSAGIEVLDVPFLVHKMLSGIYDAPVYSDGKLHPMFAEQHSNPSPEILKQIEALNKEIAKLQSEKETLQAREYEARKKYEELLVENQRLKNELTLANYRADVLQALSQDQTEKVKGMLRDYGAMLSSAMEAQVNEMLTRRINWILGKGMRKLREQIEEAYGKTIEDEVWSKIETRFRSMFDEVRSLVPKLVVKPTTPKPTEEKKK